MGLKLDTGGAGFKLDTLLKLADVKGTDRKTSLLHFVLEQLLKEENASRGHAVRPAQEHPPRCQPAGQLTSLDGEYGKSQIAQLPQAVLPM